ncbi:MAG TPA: tRNA (adenosine(37)-N6)-threonylcarbamoyltransferase complex transferase subunit TsaD [Burkholderiaceae bacterium]|nr:tRNA (adenosine(37)-N6)-threonylcarbamoyltransferase complex transferase subunit TsaD [Burkholderiaceae bacterium]
MRVLGIETSCDETGVALFDSDTRALVHALHSQADLHRAYGGVVPELASRDHVRRLLPLIREVLEHARCEREQIDAIAVTAGPGLAGALLVGCGVAAAMGYALRKPVIAVHHLEGHLLSPLLAPDPPSFPFVCLLVSGGHTQLLHVRAPGQYALLGETLDDAAGEAFDKTAQMLGLGYPGGPEVSRLAQFGVAGALQLPRPMIESGTLDLSFSGLKTAVLNAVRRAGNLCEQVRADIAREFVDAVVEVLTTKALLALERTGLSHLVVAGGVGANIQLRAALDAAVSARGGRVFYPPAELCTDNGAMIAYAGFVRLTEMPQAAQAAAATPLKVRARWDLCDLQGS